jgi:hypothetical protein
VILSVHHTYITIKNAVPIDLDSHSSDTILALGQLVAPAEGPYPVEVDEMVVGSACLAAQEALPSWDQVLREVRHFAYFGCVRVIVAAGPDRFRNCSADRARKVCKNVVQAGMEADEGMQEVAVRYFGRREMTKRMRGM